MNHPPKLPRALLWIPLSALVAGLAVLGERVYDRRVRNYVLLDNRSGRTVETIRIQVGANELSLGPLVSGEPTQARFDIDRETGIVVDGRFEGGDLLHVKGGYVTPGHYGERVQLTFLPDGSVQLIQ